MRVKPFVDTNVLVYAIAGPGPDAEKVARARELLRAGTVCMSTQVLGEFYSAVTSPRRASPLQHGEAVAWIQMWKLHDVRISHGCTWIWRWKCAGGMRSVTTMRLSWRRQDWRGVPCSSPRIERRSGLRWCQGPEPVST